MLLPALSLLGMLGGYVPPVPVVIEEPQGGRRIYDPDDERTKYEPLDKRTIRALWPPAPAIVAKASPVTRPSPVTAPAPAEPEGLDPALVAAIMAFEDDLL